MNNFRFEKNLVEILKICSQLEANVFDHLVIDSFSNCVCVCWRSDVLIILWFKTFLLLNSKVAVYVFLLSFYLWFYIPKSLSTIFNDGIWVQIFTGYSSNLHSITCARCYTVKAGFELFFPGKQVYFKKIGACYLFERLWAREWSNWIRFFFNFLRWFRVF